MIPFSKGRDMPRFKIFFCIMFKMLGISSIYQHLCRQIVVIPPLCKCRYFSENRHFRPIMQFSIVIIAYFYTVFKYNLFTNYT